MTLPGVRVVVDSGLAREPRFDPNSGFSRLDVVAISQASADQRAGRAGRVAEGWHTDCGRRRNAWSRSAGRRSRRSSWPRWHWNWRRGAAMRCASSIRRRRAHSPRVETCCSGWMYWMRVARSPRPAGACSRFGTHPRLAAMLLSAEDPPARRWPATWPPWSSARSAAHALGRLGRALAGLGRVPRRAPAGDASRCGAGRDRRGPRRNGDAACVATPARPRRRPRMRSATCSRTRSRTASASIRRIRAATCWPTGGWRLFDDSAPHGEPWLVASELRFEARDALLLRGAPLDEVARCGAGSPRIFPRPMKSAGMRDAARAGRRAHRAFRWHRAGVELPGASIPRWLPRRSPKRCAPPGCRCCPGPRHCCSGASACSACAPGCPSSACPISDAALLATLAAWLQPAFAGKTGSTR